MNVKTLMAATLLLAACSQGSNLGGTARDCGSVAQGAVLCLQAAREAPSASLMVGDERQEGIRGSGCWQQDGVGGCGDIGEVPEPEGYLTVAKGSELVVRGDARTVEASIGRLLEKQGQRRLAYVQRLQLAGGHDTIDVPPGTYVLDVFGTWDQGDSGFYFGIRVVPPGS